MSDYQILEQINATQRQLKEIYIPERSPDFISPFLGLPGLIGFWPMSSVQRSTGNVYDLSGQGRTLTYNGNPTFNYTTTGVPYIDMDGTGDYLSRADETDLDVLGTETQYANPGLTMGGWVYPTTANFEHVTGKWGAVPNRSYRLTNNSGTWLAQVSVDGTAVTNTSGQAVAANAWVFLVMKFTPSTSVKMWQNEVVTTNAAAIPASISNGTAAFTIGAPSGGTDYFTGYESLNFLSANAISDDLIQSLYQQTKSLFGY